MKDICIIENDCLRVTVERMGAQMISIVDKRTGREQLWQREPSIWQDSAPWLFPIIGRLRHDRYLWNGSQYALPMHGFAGHADFSVLSAEKDSLAFLLTDSEETRRRFPWRFEFIVEYRLADRLLITLTVKNPGSEEMFFSLGAHPGFLCGTGDKLIMETGGRLRRLNPEDHLLEKRARTLGDGPIVLSKALFRQDAMILEGPDAREITLHRQDGTGVRFCFGSVPWLGIWSRPLENLPYVCLEPWFGVDDEAEADGLLSHKPGIRRLAPGARFTWDLSIACLQG